MKRCRCSARIKIPVHNPPQAAIGNRAPRAYSGARLLNAANGDWDKVHAIVQDEEGVDAAWVHAYLHRVEGDLGNAGYWYRRAGKPVATGPVEAEWEKMVSTLLQDKPR